MKSIVLDFLKARSGNYAILFALALMPLAIAIGVGIDVTRATSRKDANQNALDAAVLAVTGAKNNGEAARMLREVYEANKGMGTPVLKDFSKTETSIHVLADASFDNPNVFAPILRYDTTRVKVTSEAARKTSLASLQIRPTGATGAWSKWVTLHVIDQADTDTELGYIEYKYSGRTGDWTGTITSNLSFTRPVTVKNAKNIYFKMFSREFGTMRTDDPDTAHYLFIDGRQLPRGTVVNLADRIGCGVTRRFDWEDGGGWSVQDFHFTVTGGCDVTDEMPAHLVR
ncbi:hypothetical protein CSC94_21910 [Zhengella mangrovi]|uniref:Putative Flp pilus-assembly TadG-like N-terminal domain-containing protein n=1 Tax=Zhengella mangrovi TaxID=1982044 RepID=A0A2G1QH58_9HYPH|nr:Tad domain-containing protein [Zhengella mangrovi]PHP64846.1 hypothetical protein CSC94_21910 [Zhengella mangrovi]